MFVHVSYWFAKLTFVCTQSYSLVVLHAVGRWESFGKLSRLSRFTTSQQHSQWNSTWTTTFRSASSPVRRAPCAFAKEVDLKFLGGVSLIQFREEQFHCQLLVGEKSRFRCLGWDIGFISFFRAVVYNESQPKNLSWEWLVKIVDFLFFFYPTETSR